MGCTFAVGVLVVSSSLFSCSKSRSFSVSQDSSSPELSQPVDATTAATTAGSNGSTRLAGSIESTKSVYSPEQLRTREMVERLDALAVDARDEAPLLQSYLRLLGPQVRRLLTDKLATTKTRKLMPAIAQDLHKDYARSSALKSARAQLERLGRGATRADGTPVSPAKREAHRQVMASVDAYDGTTTFLRGVELKEAAQGPLEAAMRHRREFDGFDISDAWRLFMDGEDQLENGDYRYEDESGYMAGVMGGFIKMLGTLDKPLDAELLIELHDACVDDVLVKGESIHAASAMRRSGVIHSGSDCYIRKDMRSGGNNRFGIIAGRNGSREGIDELRKIGDSGNITILENADGYDHVLRTSPLSNLKCRRVAQDIIEAYQSEISAARTLDDKLIAIARCCRNLEAHHLFMDGNARTIGFVLLNKLLLENRLAPAAMANPSIFDAFSVVQVAREIAEGQKRFHAIRAKELPFGQ